MSATKGLLQLQVLRTQGEETANRSAYAQTDKTTPTNARNATQINVLWCQSLGSDYENLNLFFILSQSITIKSEEIMLRDPGPHQTIKAPHPKSPMDRKCLNCHLNGDNLNWQSLVPNPIKPSWDLLIHNIEVQWSNRQQVCDAIILWTKISK